MARDVNPGMLVAVENVRAASKKVVDQAKDRLLVARDHLGAKDYGVALFDGYLAMFANRRS